MNPEPQLVCEVTEAEVGLRGYLVIDSLVNGRSCGGVRVEEDLSLGEVKALARAMTLKFGFLNDHSIGGAKAGVVLPPDCPPGRKQEILRALGRKLAAVLRRGWYVPWTDLNTRNGDIAVIREAAGLRPMTIPDSAYYTALSVLGSIRAACDFRGLPLDNATVAIEGLGNVGTHLAHELSGLGARIVAFSNRHAAVHDPAGFDVEELVRLRSQQRDEFLSHRFLERRIEKHELLELDVDVLVPAARPQSVHSDNVSRIRARIIAPAANCPVVAAVEPLLQQRGILSLPDFVCNIGGIWGSRLEDRVGRARIRSLFLNEFSQVVRRLLDRSLRQGCPPTELAVRIAEANCRRIRSMDANRLVRTRWLIGKAALWVLDSPLVPGGLAGHVLYRWAQKNLTTCVGRSAEEGSR